MRKIVFFIITGLLFISCGNKNKLKVDVSGIDVKVNVVRFEKEFYTANEKSLGSLKQKYPILFPSNQHDSIWLERINDKDEQDLFKATNKQFPDFNKQAEELDFLFKHVKYYHPNFREPRVFTVLTNMRDRVVYADSLLFISLDNYLGKNHKFYGDYPGYIRINNAKKHLIVDVAKELVNKSISNTRKRNFIERIIFEGKKMYVLDAYLPDVDDAIKIGYTENKMQWIKVNEANVWRYFIEKSYLYSTDLELSKRFIDVAPFSKFYLDEDKKSPGQVGIYMGWQIVRSYMKTNKLSLKELIQADEILIFNKSNYKPKE